jgi:ABC-2 type transport system ATP-binding protein
MIIEAAGLRKSFAFRQGRRGGTVEAVAGVDLAVADGEVFGLLGPNGAGKSTTVRMLATLLAPDAGTATVAGHDVRREPSAVRARIGYVGQGGGVDDGLTVWENLLFHARVRRLGAGRARELVDRFGLEPVAGRMAGTLSGGQKRRVALALGLVHRPPLLFLDEPTLALDPQGRARLWDEVRALRAAGTSVLLTTHYLDEADALCDRLAIVDHGRVVACGTPGGLKDGGSLDDAFLRLTGRTLREGTADAA